MHHPAPSPVRVYRSKCDRWLWIVLWAALLGMVGGAVAALLTPGAALGRIATAVLLLATAGFVVWIMTGTHYTLTQDRLVVRSGPFRWTVPFDAITRVVPTHNPLSSPALSLDRLRISYRGSFAGVMISPEPRAAFLQDLADRSPGLQRDGNRLTRTESAT